jgi:hypothetical protein
MDIAVESVVKHYTAPPASREQAEPVHHRQAWAALTEACQRFAAAGNGNASDLIRAIDRFSDVLMGEAKAERAQQPSEDVRELSKWLNEELTSPINRQALARVLAASQQPSGGEVVAAPIESYPSQDQAFYAFWYSHMLDDLMQPPLAGVSHSVARYIWDSARRRPPATGGGMTFTREDYEMAAKAAGISLDFTIRGDFPPYYVNDRGGHSSWNPLDDDGEALRLAVALGLRVSTGQADWYHWYDTIGEGFRVETDDDPCPYAATRRAIFRAAIAVGRAMP